MDPLWTHWSTARLGSFVSSPVLLNARTVYVGGRDGLLRALSASTGSLLWSFRAARDGFVQSPCLLPNGAILVPADKLYGFKELAAPSFTPAFGSLQQPGGQTVTISGLPATLDVSVTACRVMGLFSVQAVPVQPPITSSSSSSSSSSPSLLSFSCDLPEAALIGSTDVPMELQTTSVASQTMPLGVFAFRTPFPSFSATFAEPGSRVVAVTGALPLFPRVLDRATRAPLPSSSIDECRVAPPCVLVLPDPQTAELVIQADDYATSGAVAIPGGNSSSTPMTPTTSSFFPGGEVAWPTMRGAGAAGPSAPWFSTRPAGVLPTWSYRTGGIGFFPTTPAIDRLGRILVSSVGGSDQVIHAVDPATGRSVWTKTFNYFDLTIPFLEVLSIATSVAGDVFAVVSSEIDPVDFFFSEPVLHCLDGATGRSKWSFGGSPGDGGITLPPTVVEPASNQTSPTVVLATMYDVMHAFNASSGAELWTWSSPGTRPLSAPATAHRGRIFVAVARERRVWCLEALTGAVVWVSPLLSASSASLTLSTPALSAPRGMLVMTVLGSSLFNITALDLDTGAFLWAWPYRLLSQSSAYGGPPVPALDDARGIGHVASSSGLWTFSLDRSAGNVAVSATASPPNPLARMAVRAINLAAGQSMGCAGTVAINPADGAVFFCLGSTELARYSPQTGLVPWRSTSTPAEQVLDTTLVTGFALAVGPVRLDGGGVPRRPQPVPGRGPADVHPPGLAPAALRGARQRRGLP
jgi:outer membrane protein assembly factor BamB